MTRVTFMLFAFIGRNGTLLQRTAELPFIPRVDDLITLGNDEARKVKGLHYGAETGFTVTLHNAHQHIALAELTAAGWTVVKQ